MNSVKRKILRIVHNDLTKRSHPIMTSHAFLVIIIRKMNKRPTVRSLRRHS